MQDKKDKIIDVLTMTLVYMTFALIFIWCLLWVVGIDLI